MNLKPVITPHYLSLMSMYTYGSQDLREALVGASELIAEQAADIARLRVIEEAAQDVESQCRWMR